ncbi:MAG: FAD-dependent oxidoreductase [Hyphomicrobium sp.]|nr:MAG: FAD-dependent oxidoreductase [Hyphomicrobium sp.]
MSSDLNTTYYDASRNDDTRYPHLSGNVAADIAVIGGGFSGVATALTLAERGYSVVLVESRRIGAGASGRNGGQVIAGISGEAAIARQLGDDGRRMVREIRYLGHDIIQRRIAAYEIACDYKSGWMEAAAKPSHMDMLRAHVDESHRDGCDLEIVEPERMRDVLGTDAYHGAYIDRRSGHVHPLNLLLGEARAAARLGVKIFEDSPVVEFSGGARPFARTAHGRVDAKSIVLAGYSDHAFQRGRLNGLLFPTGSYIIATEALSEATVRALNPQDLAVADSNIVLDYFRTSADRRILFGGRCNYSNRDPKDLIAAMRPRLIEIFPQLKDVRIDYAWGGRIDIVITRVPAIGRLEPNVYFMQGYCGHGVNATHIAADIVSDAICGTMERFDLFDKIKHVRLPVGRWAGNQMLALGMLYYRLRDKL